MKKYVLRFLKTITIISLPLIGLMVFNRLSGDPKPSLERFVVLSGFCERVLDGDTLEVHSFMRLDPRKIALSLYHIAGSTPCAAGSESVRYAGFNAPDPGAADPADSETRSLAAAATQFNRDRVLERKIFLVCKKGEMYDVYDRVLGYVFAPNSATGGLQFYSMTHAMAEMRLGDHRYGKPDASMPKEFRITPSSKAKI